MPPNLSGRTATTVHDNTQALAGVKKVPPPIRRLLRTREGQKALGEVVGTQRVADLHQLIIESAIALALMALISTALGWVMAGTCPASAAHDDHRHPGDL